MNSKNIKCTVAIVTYNQIDYIRKAIESVLEQKTDFDFEIIIHDDKSSDGTTEIVKEYASKYSNIIPIFENENQYSKGNEYLQLAIKKYIKGEYFILLEGDDYWCDSLKLQKQVDFLDKNKDYVAITHLCLQINQHTLKKTFAPTGRRNNTDWSIEEIIDWKNTFQTTTLMYRSKYYGASPQEWKKFEGQDFAIATYLIMQGKIGYINEAMSVHRLYATGSITGKNYGNAAYYIDYDIAEKNIKEREILCEKMDEYSEYKFHNILKMSQERRFFTFLWEKKEYKKAKRNQYYKTLGIRKKIYLFCSVYFPWIVSVINKFRSMIKT